MKRVFQRLLIFIIFSLILFVMATCSTGSNSTINSSTDTLAPVSTSIVDNYTAVPPTIEVVPSQIPTLSSQEKILVLESMFLESEICDLPCWWDITPGFSDWESTIMKFERLSQFVTYTTPENKYDQVGFSIGVVPAYANEYFGIGIIKSVDSKNVEAIIISGLESDSFSLSYFFERLGVPDQIYLSTYYETWMEYRPFSVDVYYESEGVLLSYSTNGTVNEEFIQGCFGDKPDSIRLWQGDDSKDYVSKAESLGWNFVGVEFPMRLEDATGMTNNEFYDQFRLSGTACLQTERAIWKTGN